MSIKDWDNEIAGIIYKSYPNADEAIYSVGEEFPPGGLFGEITEFKHRISDSTDDLFKFIVSEAAEDCENAGEFCDRLDRAIRDIEAVQQAVLDAAME